MKTRNGFKKVLRGRSGLGNFEKYNYITNVTEAESKQLKFALLDLLKSDERSDVVNSYLTIIRHFDNYLTLGPEIRKIYLENKEPLWRRVFMLELLLRFKDVSVKEDVLKLLDTRRLNNNERIRLISNLVWVCKYSFICSAEDFFTKSLKNNVDEKDLVWDFLMITSDAQFTSNWGAIFEIFYDLASKGEHISKLQEPFKQLYKFYKINSSNNEYYLKKFKQVSKNAKQKKR